MKGEAVLDWSCKQKHILSEWSCAVGRKIWNAGLLFLGQREGLATQFARLCACFNRNFSLQEISSKKAASKWRFLLDFNIYSLAFLKFKAYNSLIFNGFLFLRGDNFSWISKFSDLWMFLFRIISHKKYFQEKFQAQSISRQKKSDVLAGIQISRFRRTNPRL